MFKNTEDLKDFIIWSKSQKIKRIKLDAIEVEFSDIAHLENINVPGMAEISAEDLLKQKLSDAEDNDENLLFASSSGSFIR